MSLLSKIIPAPLLILLLAPLATPSQMTDMTRVGPVRAALVAENTAIQPGRPFLVGFLIAPDEHWHVYWSNPGDAGMPPALEWRLPAGFSAGAIQWPAPEKIDAGPLTSYGYHGEVLYPVEITPPADLKAGDTLRLKVSADWLVCRVECLPGSANLSLDLAVSDNTPARDDRWADLFDRAKQHLPQPFPAGWTAQATIDDDKIYLDIKIDSNDMRLSDLAFFPAATAIIEHSAPQPFTAVENSYRMTITRSPYSQGRPDSLTGVLQVTQSDDSAYYSLTLPFGTLAPQTVAATTSAITTIFAALFFAFVGGLILNLMPCVLPVLSLKVLGLVEQANQSRRSALSHGLVFTAGVTVSFWVIVAIMLLLQAGGQQIGWGFQLQSPQFVIILSGFLFLFALSLFGVYEIGFLATSAGSISGRKHSGASGAFISGITATLVATPCTAPFMGAALGYSLTQPPVYSLLIYTMLGFGMAAPYLLLSTFPGLLKFVPKPGRWMETLRQALGFILAATVVWLGWVLANQAGSTAVTVMLGMLLLISVGAWIYGRWGGITSATNIRWMGRIVATTVLIVAFGAGSSGISAFGKAPEFSETATGNDIAWQEFSQAHLDKLRNDGKAVFIDFTASWCLSCQVNEKVAFSSDEVRKRFKDLNIVPLKADWTIRSDEITRALAEHGRNSVPLYLLYPPDKNLAPLVLPEILTPEIVLDALDKIDKQMEISK